MLRGRTRITGVEQENGDRQHEHVARLTLNIFVKSESVLKYLYVFVINP